MVSPEIEAAARRNFKRVLVRGLVVGLGAAVIAGVLIGVFGARHHTSHHANRHVSALGWALVVGVPILVLIVIGWAAWYFGRKFSLFKPTPLFAVDPGRRRQVWRAARRGDPLAIEDVALVLGHADGLRRFRILGWVWVVLGAGELVLFSLASESPERWLQLVVGIVFLVLGVLSYRQVVSARRVRERYAPSGS